jgi:hypothetical protein
MAERRHSRQGYRSSWIRPTTRLAIQLRDGLCCGYCLQDWSVAGLTIDHIVARDSGGTNEATNLISACPRCNGLKRDRDTATFAAALGLKPKQFTTRLQGQATPLTCHLRERARKACAYPPPWLKELRVLNTRWEAQAGLFPLPAIRPMVHVEEPKTPGAPPPPEPSNDDIPF